MNENDWLRLTRHITGESSADERQETARWIAASPDRAELVRRLQLGWERASRRDEPFDVERAWDEVVRRKTVRSAPGVYGDSSPAGRRPAAFRHFDHWHQRRRWPAALAASMVLALGVGVAWRAVRAGWQPASLAAGPMRTVTTQPGQIADIYLSDGTHVRLAAASTLRFPTAFGRTRQVALEGEGYFDVMHDPAREFSVRTADAVARDVGTRFNVRAYPGDHKTEVVVAEGAVALQPGATPAGRRGADNALLTQADFGRVDSTGVTVVAHQVAVADYLAWMDGHLVFADTPLRDALPRLSRWYGVTLTTGDAALASTRLTATLEANSLPDALHRLAAVLDARVERQGSHGQTIVLYPRRLAR